MSGVADNDPHAELGVARAAGEREIKQAYRRLAAQWHPDRNPHPGAAERMKRLNRALRRLLGDGAQQAATEAEPAAPGAEPDEPPARARPAWWERDWGRPRWVPDGSRRPGTVHHEWALDLEQAAFGCVFALQGSVVDLCATCAGSGQLLSTRVDCTACRGEGRRRGPSGRWLRCTECRGDGAQRKPCTGCRGSGEAAGGARAYHFEVRVPAGVRDGQTLVLRGQGQRGADGAGDIEVRITYRPHPLFGFDAAGRLSCRVPVDCYAAAAGAVDVPTLDGGLVPVQASAGLQQLLEGRGFPQADGTRGPLAVSLQIVTPRRHDARQAALLRRLADELRRTGYAGCEDVAAWQSTLEAWRAAAAARRAR